MCVWVLCVYMPGKSLATYDWHANANHMQMQAESEQIPSPARASTAQAGGPAGARAAHTQPSLATGTAHHTSVLRKRAFAGALASIFLLL